MLTEKERAERYDLIVGYFQDKLQKRADKLEEEFIYYDEWKHPRHKDETERAEEVSEDFISEMDELGFWEFGELMAYEVFGESVSLNNQFHDHVYGE